MTDNLHIDGFGVEVHMPNQINYQQINKVTLSAAIADTIEHYKPWSEGKLERIVLKPRYIYLLD
jgi:hypothetical protein